MDNKSFIDYFEKENVRLTFDIISVEEWLHNYSIFEYLITLNDNSIDYFSYASMLKHASVSGNKSDEYKNKKAKIIKFINNYNKEKYTYINPRINVIDLFFSDEVEVKRKKITK